MRHTLEMMPLTFSEKHDLTAEIKQVFLFWAYVLQEDEFLNLLETRQIEEISSSTDYGHMKAKFLILCGPNSNSNPK